MRQGRVMGGTESGERLGDVHTIGRRRLLRRAAVGGALVWTAPLIQQFPAAAQGSPGGGPTTTTTSTTLPPLAPLLLGTFGPAAAQASAWGRRLQEMAIFDGIVFVGYGDWGSNTGPITAGGWHIANAAMVSEAALDTENTWTHRVVNNRLIVPYIDPRNDTGDLARRSAGSNVWTNVPIDTVLPVGAGSWHCFDAATFNGTDLWVCGARIGQPEAAVWHSPSGNGGDWVEVLTYTPPVGFIARFTHMVAYNGRIYVGGYEWDGVNPVVGIEGQSWNGLVWAPAPEFSFISGADRPGHRPLVFDGGTVHLLFAGATLTAYPMLFFDGASLTVGPQTAFHHNVDDVGRLWWINSLGQVYKQDPGGVPVFVVNAPAGASCLAVQGTDLYIGTATSQIWRVSPV